MRSGSPCPASSPSPTSDDGGGELAGRHGHDPATGSGDRRDDTLAPRPAPPSATAGEPATGDDGNRSSDGNETPQGVAGENPNAGPGNNSGNGNPNPGEGNQGNPGGGQTGAETPEPPANNLPAQSNGKGNGPPQVPPGQAKK